MRTLGQVYLESVIGRITTYKTLADRTFAQLEEKHFHFVPAPGSNSIALIIQHVSGNMLSRWTNFLTEDGEKEWRDRETEFSPHSYDRAQLMPSTASWLIIPTTSGRSCTLAKWSGE